MERKTNKIVDIVTINNYTNYGNSIQSNALTILFQNYRLKVVNAKEDQINRTESLEETIKGNYTILFCKHKNDYSNNCVNNSVK